MKQTTVGRRLWAAALALAVALVLAAPAAAWGAATYIVTFHDGLGAVVDSQRVAGGGTASDPGAPAIGLNYRFEGWYTENYERRWSFGDRVAANTSLYAKWSGGDGTAAAPFLIYTPAEMQAVGTNEDGWTLDSSYLLMADMTVEDWVPIGGHSRNNPFAGHFNGNGHVVTVKNMEESPTPIFYRVGFFSRIGSSGVVEHLGVHWGVGGEPARAGFQGEYDIAVSGFATANFGVISRCFVSGTLAVSGGNHRNYAGGNVGTCPYNNMLHIGAIAAGNNGAITDCYSTLTITESAPGSLHGDGRTRICYVGGITECGRGTVSRCYVTGGYEMDITDVASFNGFSGIAYGVSDSVALSSRAALTVNGVAQSGERVGSGVNNYAWKHMTDGNGNLLSEGGDNGTDVDLDDIIDPGFYKDTLGWDFENDWTFLPGYPLPVLAWQTEPPATPAHLQ